MDAIEARERASKVKENKIIKEYQDILEVIKIAVDRGEYQTYYYKSISKGVMDKLKSLGYSVSETNNRNEVLVTIKW